MEILPTLWSTLLIYLGSVILALADENEYRLIRDLSKRYDKRVRPSVNSSHPLNVTFGAALAQIIDVDERNQILTTNCWINQNWLDNELSWDPSLYGDIKVIRLPFDNVWQPDILLYNNADVKGNSASVSTNVIVDFKGNVTLLSMVIYKSSCSIDVKYFPFDSQNCTLKFASWTYEAAMINIMKTDDEGDISNYMENSEWQLGRVDVRRMEVHFSCCPTDPYIFMAYDIIIQRRPLFYLFNMVMPCILITLVALLGFYMPSDSGEKVSMGITTLLSITVFLMIVAESMPPTSDVLPLIGIYYGITIVIVSSATGLTVVTLNIHHNGSRASEVPVFLKKICFGYLAKILCVKFDRGSSNISSSSTSSFPGQSVVSIINKFIGVFSNRLASRAYTFKNNRLKFYLLKKLHSVRGFLFCSTATASMESHIGLNSEQTDGTQNCRKWMMDKPEYPERTTGRGQDFSIFHDEDIYLDPSFNPRQRNLKHFPHNCQKLDAESKLHNAHGSRSYSPKLSNKIRLPQLPPSGGDEYERQFMKVLSKVYQTLERNEIRLADQDRRDAIKQEWQQLALVIDRLLMFIYLLTTFIVTCAVLLQGKFLKNIGSRPKSAEPATV